MCRLKFFMILLSCSIGLAAYAVDDYEEELDNIVQAPPHQLVVDKDEELNRSIFHFNEGVYKYALFPATKIYRGMLLHPWVVQRTHHFFDNLKEPVYMINALLQGDPKSFFVSTFRFVINSTIGLGGAFDVAAKHKSAVVRPLGFNSTLTKFKFHHGPYTVVPILGPSGMRRTVGVLLDTALDPLSLATNPEIARGRAVLEFVDKVDRIVEPYNDLTENAIDKYAMVRDVYMQMNGLQLVEGHHTKELHAPIPNDLKKNPSILK